MSIARDIDFVRAKWNPRASPNDEGPIYQEFSFTCHSSIMDLGFSRRVVKQNRKKLTGMSYHALMAELIAAQTDSPTSRAQRQLGAPDVNQAAPEGHSFHSPTADLLREAKEE